MRIFWLFFNTICCILASCANLHATGAAANIIKYRQPDGSIISLKMFGDEFFGYSTTADGYIVAMGKDGYYYYADYNSGFLKLSDERVNAKLSGVKSNQFPFVKAKGVPSTTVASLRRHAMERYMPFGYMLPESPAVPALKSSGQIQSRHSLVLLVQFSDIVFTVDDTRSYFNRLLNEEGYSLNGASGSVADYFNCNFREKCTFSFEVTDIITLSKPRSYYGEHTAYLNDANVAGMVVEACKIAAEQGVDFSGYDQNGDGAVDNVSIIFAGMNEAESGDAFAIWPHKGDISDKNIFCNGVKIASYTCTSEYSGDAVDSYPASIGSFCHEYAHCLGLVDMYDVNGEEEGLSNCLHGNLSLMDKGNYLDGGKTPPLFNSIERQMLGIAVVKDMEETGIYRLGQIGDADTLFRIKSLNEGEYFLLECRMQDGWDKEIGGEGLVVYHVDKSSNMCGGLTAASRWQLNIVNSYAQHECARIVAADLSNTVGQSVEYLFYPGKSSITSLSSGGEPPFTDWLNFGVGVSINDIKYSNGVAEFSIMEDIVYKEDVLSASNLKIDTYQNQALCTWSVAKREYSAAGNWVLAIESDTGFSKKIKIVADTLFYLFDGLEPATEYRGKLYFVEDNFMGEVNSFSFCTDRISSQYPYIKLSGEYEVGDVLNLSPQNVVEKYDSIDFFINGERWHKFLYQLDNEGVYNIEVIIRYPDKSMEIINKRLHVK